MKRAALVAAVAFVLPVAPALAGTVIIDNIGGAVPMDSKDLSASVFGGFGSPTFANSVLKAVHDDLNLGGITTDGFVTMILAQTDAGLSFMALVDDESGSGFLGFNSILNMSTTAIAGTPEFINDSGSDITSGLTAGGQKTAAGDFRWDSATRGDAIAWAGLVNGDFLTFSFNEILAPGTDSDSANGAETTANGLSGPDLFQFVSWTGGAWSIVAQRDFSVNNQFAFSVMVIPLPTSAGLAAVGLLGVAGIRRRRTV